MKLKYIFLQIFILLSAFSFAQKKPCDIKFHSINSLSLLNGNNEVSAGLQTVNGLKKGNWFVGAGVGLDYYIHRSVPVFADIRYEFGKEKNKFFAYADGGVNFDWAEDYEYSSGPIIFDGPGVDPGKFQDGYYTDAGLGYIVNFKKTGSIVLSLGHTRKTSRQDVTYTDWRTGESTTDIYRYRFNRIALKVGWRF